MPLSSSLGLEPLLPNSPLPYVRLHEDDSSYHSTVSSLSNAGEGSTTIQEKNNSFAIENFGAFISLLLQIVCSLIVLFFDDNLFLKQDTGFWTCLIVCVCQALQVLVLIFVIYSFSEQFMIGVVTFAMMSNIVFSFILLFGGVYFLVLGFDASSFTMTHTEFNNPVNVMISCIYFSIATFTTVGLGDVIPIVWYSQIIVSLEMLLSVVFQVGFFAIFVNHFRANVSTKSDHQHHVFSEIFKTIRLTFPIFESVRVFFLRYCLLINVLIQAMVVSLVIFVDNSVLNEHIIQPHVIMALIIQIFQFLVMFFVSWRLVRKVKNNNVNISFLVQSYLSNIFSYAGIYMIYFLMVPKGDSFVWSLNRDSNLDLSSILPSFFFLSMTVASTTGFGDIVPVSFLSRLLCSFQMISTLFYNVVVLGLGVCHIIVALEDYKLKREKEKSCSSVEEHVFKLPNDHLIEPNNIQRRATISFEICPPKTDDNLSKFVISDYQRPKAVSFVELSAQK